MKNRKLLLIVSLVLALTMSLGGTLAYLQDTDADVNTMVLGNVTITQNEQERDADGNLVPFTQDKPLLPAVYQGDGLGWANAEEYPVPNDNNWMVYVDNDQVLDKFVTVTNTGNTPAYVRTIIAFESDQANKSFEDGVYLKVSANNSDKIKPPSRFTATIHGKTYSIQVFTYEKALGAKETSSPSLRQVYINKEAGNEYLQSLDVNGNGKYDILVLSQAVQASGFTDANNNGTAADEALNTGFGDPQAKDADDVMNVVAWFEKLYSADGTVNEDMVGTPGEDWPTNDVPGAWVSSADELTAALAEGGSVALSDNITVDKIDLTSVEGDVVIDANNNKITTTDSYGIQVTAGKNITIANAEVVMTKEGDWQTYAAGLKIENGDYNGATIKLENCKITMANGDWAYAVNLPSSVSNLNLVIDNCKLEGAIAVQCWGDNNTITITNSKLICNYTTNEQYTSYCVALQTNAENCKLLIDNCEFAYNGSDLYNKTIYSVADNGTNNSVTVTNCTYGAKVAAYTAE